MKHLLVPAFLISMLSVWSVAQRPQTDVEMRRPGTSAQVNRPQTVTGAVRPNMTAVINRPTTQIGAVRAQTNASAQRPQTAAGAVYPATTVQTVKPVTTVETTRPQTAEFSAVQGGVVAGQKGGKSAAVTSTQAATSMSNFTPKQAKDFTSAQKAAPLGGGDNKLGNDTNAAEKDAANKASMLGKQSNQNMEVDPNLKKGNLAAIGSAVDKKVEGKKKKK